MKIFTPQNSPWPDRLNFVDKNGVLVGYDMEQNCCEQFDWMIGYLRGNNDLDETDSDLLEPYCFDAEYTESFGGDETRDEECNQVAFRLTAPNRHDLFLVLRNQHNGYYSHGFGIAKDGIVLHSGVL